MQDQYDPDVLEGATVRTTGGDKIGKVARSTWTIRPASRSGSRSDRPVRHQGELRAAGRGPARREELVVDVTKEQVNGAPRVDEDGHLSEAQEAEIYRYYGISAGTDSSATGQDYGGTRDPGRDTPAGRPTMR